LSRGGQGAPARVALTGIGVVASYRIGVYKCWESVREVCGKVLLQPPCPVDPIAGAARAAQVNAAIIHSFGFGGINSGVVLRKHT